MEKSVFEIEVPLPIKMKLSQPQPDIVSHPTTPLSVRSMVASEIKIRAEYSRGSISKQQVDTAVLRRMLEDYFQVLPFPLIHDAH